LKTSRRNFGKVLASAVSASALGCKIWARPWYRNGELAESDGAPEQVRSAADGFVPQRGVIPIEVERHSITYLMADEARRSASLKEFIPLHNPLWKRFWIQNWRQPGQFFEWDITAPQSGKYQVTFIVSAPRGTAITVRLPGAHSSLECETTWVDHLSRRYNWDRLIAPSPLCLLKGHSTVRIQLRNPIEDTPVGAALKSVELLNVDRVTEMEECVRAFRSDTEWLNRAKFGLMFQWGEWGYPRHGPKKQWLAMINDFDVPKFVEMVASTKAGYVVWSATWATYYFPAPIKAIDRILPGRTCKRDLIGELADALRGRGIKLMVYYHCGHGDKEWWAKNWVSNDDKRLFFHNWINIIQEAGERYGDRLAGWMYDDDCVYYPAPYEQLGEAAKAGFRERIISYNPWIIARGTDFQDLQFGEGFHGDSSTPIGGSGIYAAGPHKGLHAHGMFILDGPGWGIHRPDTVISPPRFSKDQAIAIALNAAARNQALSWNLLMYEDGSVSGESLHLMRSVGNALRKVRS
jgi:hypothetical protein